MSEMSAQRTTAHAHARHTRGTREAHARHTRGTRKAHAPPHARPHTRLHAVDTHASASPAGHSVSSKHQKQIPKPRETDQQLFTTYSSRTGHPLECSKHTPLECSSNPPPWLGGASAAATHRVYRTPHWSAARTHHSQQHIVGPRLRSTGAATKTNRVTMATMPCWRVCAVVCVLAALVSRARARTLGHQINLAVDQQSPQEGTLEALLHSTMDQYVANLSMGAWVAVATPGWTLATASGYSDVSKQTPARATDIIPAGSLTKTWTAAYGAFALIRAPYVVYGVKYIELVSLSSTSSCGRPLVCTASLSPYTPRAVAYHAQSHYCRFTIGRSLARIGISYCLTTFPFI